MHPSTEALLDFFAYGHLREPQASISASCAGLADKMAEDLADSDYPAEVTTGLRKLMEAKDCFVRASLTKRTPMNPTPGIRPA